MATVKIYAGEDYAWGFGDKNGVRGAGDPELQLTDAGLAKLKAVFGDARRRVTMTPGDPAADDREHIVVEG